MYKYTLPDTTLNESLLEYEILYETSDGTISLDDIISIFSSFSNKLALSNT